jgi:hypothetical protein
MPVSPKYRVTVYHPTRWQRWVLRKTDEQVSLEKYDGRRKEYMPIATADVGARRASGLNKSN